MNAVAEKETQTEVQPASAEREYVTPGVSIIETDQGYVLEAEMPGVNKQGLTVSLEANVLTLEGRRQTAQVPGTLLYRESSNADFRRVFELDPEIDGARISARIEQGLLTVQLPKAEKVKPRKIEVA
ncbi:MAG TPA: Hsp20/alpha crystallin family protein [Verrucomicrobiae bacterium]|jgi:HSP20 family protein|nr:Hsp20/alpha crystallin family protein [Verrucomicrobiae bacterium]